MGMGFIALIICIDLIECDHTAIQWVKIGTAEGHYNIAGMCLTASVITNGEGKTKSAIRIDAYAAQAGVIFGNIKQRTFRHLLHDVFRNPASRVDHISVIRHPTPWNLGRRRRIGGRIHPTLGVGITILVEDRQERHPN